MVYLYQDAPTQGISALKRALALAPGHVEVHCLLGEAYATSGQPDSARHFFTRALNADSTSVRAHHGLAKVAYQAGDPQAAVLASQRALTSDPDHRDSHYLLGLAHVQLEQPRKAWRSLQACIELDPGDVEALYRQGLLLVRHGLADEAQRAFASVLQRDPNHAAARQQLMRLGTGAMNRRSNALVLPPLETDWRPRPLSAACGPKASGFRCARPWHSRPSRSGRARRCARESCPR